MRRPRTAIIAATVAASLVVLAFDANAVPTTTPRNLVALSWHSVEKPVPPDRSAKKAGSFPLPKPQTVLVTPSLPAPSGLRTNVVLGAAGAWTSIGTAGLALALADGSTRRASVEVLDPTQVHDLGLHGLVLRVTGSSLRNLALSVSTDLLTGLYGADFASRAQWLQLSGCTTTRCTASTVLPALRVPTAASSHPTVTAIHLGTEPQSSSRALTAPQHQAVVATASPAGATALFTPMAATNSAKGTGDSSVSSLAPSSQWTVTPQTGDFRWTYPLRVPPAASGPLPSLSLSYDSNSITGQTGGTNNQPSQIGEGFDLAGGGYIEHTYTGCANAGITNSGDLCWKQDNATLMLSGQSTSMIKNSAGGWTLPNDDNTKIEHLVGNSTLCNNGTYDNDCWRLTGPDGTQYYFGSSKLPTTTTHSTWTVPVCGTPTTACSGTATTATPFNAQAWRWNLDYVVDVHNQSEVLYYATETNKYAEKQSTTVSVSYTRGGYLTRIDYGMHAGYETSAKAPDQVLFTVSNRCETGQQNEPAGACSTNPPASGNYSYWPDVPWSSFYCNVANCSTNVSPTFWSAVMLTKVSTQYYDGTKYVPVDSWSLVEQWNSTGDGNPLPPMTLYSVTHSGVYPGTGTTALPSITLPATTFTYNVILPNRITPASGASPLIMPRLNGMTTDSGAHITVNYLATDCSSTNLPTAQTDTKRCFQEYWAPTGVTPAPDWFAIYPVQSVIADPVTGGTADAANITTYSYIGTPAYRLDTSPLTKDGYRTWSVFAGFSKVRVEHGDPNIPTTLQTTDYTYLQGMDGDIASPTGGTRSVSATASDGTQVKDSLWWAGNSLETIVYNGMINATTPGPVVSDTVSVPWASAATSTAPGVTEKIGTSSTTFSYVATSRHTGKSSQITYLPLSTGGTRVTKTDNTFDSRGRVIDAENLGDTSVTGDETCTVTSYVDNTTTGWILDAPDEVNQYAGTCAALPSAPATATISDVRTSYDKQAWGTAPKLGDATQMQRAATYSGTTVASWLTTSTIVDALGRSTSTTDPMSRTTSTSYSPKAPLAGAAFTGDIGPVGQTVVTDPMGFTTTSTVTPAWGSTIASTDVNSRTTTTQYDALGRITGVWGPDRPVATNPTPNTGYRYTTVAGQPFVVATSTLTPTGGTKTSYSILDGLLRPRQTQAPAEASTYNAAPGSGGSSITDTLYTAAGQISTTYGPFPATAAPSAALYPTTFSNVATSSTTLRDGAGRTTAVITYASGVEQWRTTTAYPGTDRTDVTPPSGGTATTTYIDALGRTTRQLQYHGSTVGDPSAAGTYDETDYTFWPTGPMRTMTNQAQEQWSWTYNTLGQTINAVDPDTGTTTYSYDNDGELQSTSDATGSKLWYSYDLDGRQSAINQTSSAGPLLDGWQYDTVPGGKDMLASSTSYVGSVAGTPGTPYTETVTGYDAAGRATGTTLTLPAGTFGAGSAAYAYTRSATYNPDGSIATQTEPAVPATGGLPQDVLTYTYTSLGRLYSLVGNKPYLTSTGYDAGTGVITGQTRSNGVYRLTDAYSYTPGTLRLSNVQTTDAASTNNLAANITYSYDPAGDISGITNAPASGPADNQCFAYDYLQRLTQAWTPAGNDCASAPTNTSIGGPAPYWQAYTYAPDGNRLSVTNYATSPTGADQRDTYAYPTGVNPTQSHAVTTVTHQSAPAGTTTYATTGTDSYTYTADGQTKSAPGQTLSWTPQGQLATIRQTSSGASQTRIYDCAGNLLVQSDPVNGTTAYLGDTDIHVAAGSTTLVGQRIYAADGRTFAVRTGASSLSYLDSDPQGTSQLAESYTTGQITNRYFDPFGNSRGNAVAWPEDRTFLNDPVDGFSGFVNIGARVYVATLGRFLSVDPKLETNDPQAVNGYAYADNSPVTKSDPSGKEPRLPGSCFDDDPKCLANSPPGTTCDANPCAPGTDPAVEQAGATPPLDEAGANPDRTTVHNLAINAIRKALVTQMGFIPSNFLPYTRLNGAAKRCMYPGYKAVDCSYGVPDLVYRNDDGSLQVWEIKAASQAALAVPEAQWYAHWLSKQFGVPVSLGVSYAPQQFTAPSGAYVVGPDTGPGSGIYTALRPPSQPQPQPTGVPAPAPRVVPVPVPTQPTMEPGPVPAPNGQIYQPGIGIVAAGTAGGAFGLWLLGKLLSPLCGPAVEVCAVAG